MIDLKKLRDIGEPWTIWLPLTADAVLAVPAASVRLNAGIGGGPKPLNSERLVILGFFYSFEAANGNGFDLVSRSTSISPGGTTDTVIWGDRATTAITTVKMCVPECWIPLDAGLSSPSLQNGAKLVLDVTATGPTRGNIVMWGVTVPGNEPLNTNRYFGSPFDHSAIPPTTP